MPYSKEALQYVIPHSRNNTNSIHLLPGNIKTSLHTCIWKYPFYMYKLQYNTIYPCLDYPVSRYPYMHFFYINSSMCKLGSCPLSKPYCPRPFGVLQSLSALFQQLCCVKWHALETPLLQILPVTFLS